MLLLQLRLLTLMTLWVMLLMLSMIMMSCLSVSCENAVPDNNCLHYEHESEYEQEQHRSCSNVDKVYDVDDMFTVFMCADSGEYSGAHELGFLYNSLEHRQDIELDYCHQAAIGLLRHADGYYLKTLVVTSGIGYLTAGLCTRSVLRLHAERHSIDSLKKITNQQQQKSSNIVVDSSNSYNDLAEEHNRWWWCFKSLFCNVKASNLGSTHNYCNASLITFKSIVYIGTAGFSPWIGGWNPSTQSVVSQTYGTNTNNDNSNKTVTSQHSTMEYTPNEFIHVETPSSLYITHKAYKQRKEAEEKRAWHRGRMMLNNMHVNFEHVISQEQLYEDGCSPLRVEIQSNTNNVKEKTISNTSNKGKSHKEKHQPNRPHKQVAVGSVCVTSGAFLQESTMCVEDVVYSQCGQLTCKDMPFHTHKGQTHYLFNNSFANAIIAASRDKTFPEMPIAVRNGLQAYWGANEAMTMLSTTNTTAAAASVEENVKELTATIVSCVESTMNAISGGARIDERCRRYTAATLNREFELSDHGTEANIEKRKLWSEDDVVCVQAMEGFGFLHAMHKYAPELPVAIIRTASNYDMYPQQKMYLSASLSRRLLYERMPELFNKLYYGNNNTHNDSNLEDNIHHNNSNNNNSNSSSSSDDLVNDIRAYTWRQNEEYVSAAEHESFVMASFHYSIETVTFVLSNYFLGGRNLLRSEENETSIKTIIALDVKITTTTQL